MGRNKNNVNVLKPGGSWVCACGITHKLTGYISVHWNERIIHSCYCKRKVSIQRGVMTPVVK